MMKYAFMGCFLLSITIHNILYIQMPTFGNGFLKQVKSLPLSSSKAGLLFQEEKLNRKIC